MGAPAFAPTLPLRPILSEKERVQQALNNDQFVWRTAYGISQETGIAVEDVNRILELMSDSLVRSAIPDSAGRARYTTLEHYRAHAGILRRVLDTLSDQVR